MRRLIPALVAVLVPLSLLAQVSPPSGKAGVNPEPSCTVSGRVLAAPGGNPLRSAKITLVPEHGGHRTQLYATTTDGDGRFLLKDVTPGRYHFAASHGGFVTQSYKAKGTYDVPMLWLRPGEHLSDVLFRLIIGGVVTGRVTDENGESIVGAQVVALREPSEEELEDEGGFPSRKSRLLAVTTAQSDDRGQYRIFGLSPGEYYLKVVDSSEPEPNDGLSIANVLGSEYAPTYYPGVVQVSQAQLISVKAGDEVQADLFMQRTKTARISGLVIAKDGPSSNTWVTLSTAGGDDYGMQRETTTDEKGRFELKGVPPGSYIIAAFQRDDRGGFLETRGQQKVEVSGENIDSVIISLGSSASLQGRITVDGSGPLQLGQIGVALHGTDEEQTGGLGRVKKDGSFEIKLVSDGTYGVTVWGLESNWYVKSMRLGGDDLLEKGLQVEKGGSGGRIEVVLSAASAQLEGSVSADDGAVAGARVRVVPEPETPYNRFRGKNLRTDQTGHFSFIGLAPGRYRVIARCGSAAEGDPLKSEPQIVTLSEREHKTIQLAVVKAQ